MAGCRHIIIIISVKTTGNSGSSALELEGWNDQVSLTSLIQAKTQVSWVLVLNDSAKNGERRRKMHMHHHPTTHNVHQKSYQDSRNGDGLAGV